MQTVQTNFLFETRVLGSHTNTHKAGEDASVSEVCIRYRVQTSSGVSLEKSLAVEAFCVPTLQLFLRQQVNAQLTLKVTLDSLAISMHRLQLRDKILSFVEASSAKVRAQTRHCVELGWNTKSTANHRHLRDETRTEKQVDDIKVARRDREKSSAAARSKVATFTSIDAFDELHADKHNKLNHQDTPLESVDAERRYDG
jgi:hypothetical protein